MIAYVKSCRNWQTKDVLEFESYSITDSIDFTGKSSITVAKAPNISNDDFVILMDGATQLFFGICEEYSSSDDSAYTIVLKQFETLFDRNIFAGTTSVISSTGVEDYIKATIEANWTASGDTMVDMDFITVTATTHTPKDSKPREENGVCNLNTYLGTVKKLYGIVIQPAMTDAALTLTVKKLSDSALPIDVTVSDISGYDEVYSVDALAKLMVKWLNKETEVVTAVTYYLKTDKSITTDATDPDRAAGSIKAIYYEAESAAEVLESAKEEFANNAYEHKITFNLQNESYAYPVADYYVGRNASIKTKTGIKTSLITEMTISSDASYTTFVFGALKVTLLDKLKELRRS